MIHAGEKLMEARRRRNRIALSLLLAVALGLVAFRVQGRLGKARTIDHASEAVATRDLADASADGQIIPVTWPIEAGRDPFVWDEEEDAPPTLPPPKPIAADVEQDAQTSLHLQAILNDGSPGAMINGQIVRPGQVIEGFRVERVEKRRVIVVRDGVVVGIGL